jgi:DTW domain-containing protein YfiP
MTATRRPRCAACFRPQSACICAWARPLDTAVELLILQHPMESTNAKNSAGLLRLSLGNSRLVVGELFDGPALLAGLPPKTNLLLYPQDGLAPRFEPGLQPAPALRLILLDATWRKSRKMLHLNPWLHQLPRLALDDTTGSRYLIRKAHKPGQLSSFEAGCAALAQLEGAADRFTPLLEGFDGFVAQQLQRSGQAQSPRSMRPEISTPAGAL